MIVDTHLHVFPFLGGACGYESAEARMKLMQLVSKRSQPRHHEPLGRRCAGDAPHSGRAG